MTSGPRVEEAKDDLWDAILLYSYQNMDHIIESIKRAFKKDEEAFAEFLTRSFGLDSFDAKGSSVDNVLGDKLITLHQMAFSYDQSMAQLNALILFAWGITDTIFPLHDRLKYLLRKTRLANELYKLICTLGLPKRAHGTFVDAAMVSQAFASLNFHLGPTAPSPRRVRFAIPPAKDSPSTATALPKPVSQRPATRTSTPITANTTVTTKSPATASRATASRATTSRATASRGTARSQPNPNNNTTTLPTPRENVAGKKSRTPPLSPQPRPQSPQEEAPLKQQSEPGQAPSTAAGESDTLATVRPYLAAEDKALSLAQFQPKSKQETVQLADTVLRRQLLPTWCDAWYSFGFVTTQSEEEERQLGGLYAAILREAKTPTAIFREMLQALETHTLVRLFDIKEYGHFRQLFPQLEHFLRTPTEKLSSVWRLKHYLRIDRYTEPAPVLKRDYGYQFCKQHQEVALLNDIYTHILAKSSPKELHGAAIHGRIAEFAQQKGVYVERKHRRLLQNDYGHPSIGFDNGDGLEKHRLPLFKRTPKL